MLNAPQQTTHAAGPTAMVAICGVSLAPIEYRGKRVMALSMMDEVHRRPEGTAGRNFRENRSRLNDGEDFFEINQPDEIRRLGFSRPQGGTPAMVLVLTETGYSMIVKSFTDDLAWDVQRQLVNFYFKRSAALPNFEDPIDSAEAWLAIAKEKRAEAARADAEAAERQKLEHQVAEMAPAAAALERIASDGENFCLTDAAKHLQLAPRRFTKLLLDKGWIYVREAKKGYVASQPQIDSDYLTHRYGNYQDPDTGQWKKSAQVLVTSKGIAKLAKMLSIQLPTQQGNLQI